MDIESLNALKVESSFSMFEVRKNFVIEIKNLTISFNSNCVLKGIDLKIHRHKITTIVGQSGSGKSVLMKAIEGLIIPESGKILIDEIDLFSLNRKKLKKVRRKIAMLFQGAALLDSLSVFQNVAHRFLRRHRLRARDRMAVRRLVDVAGISRHRVGGHDAESF